MPVILVLTCLVLGIGAISSAQRRPEQAIRLEKIGGALVVVGLIGLGFMLGSRTG